MMKPSIQHQGRELLHVIGLLTRCLRIPDCSATARTRWERGTLSATRDLETLYDAGLRRDFLGGPAARFSWSEKDFADADKA